MANIKGGVEINIPSLRTNKHTHRRIDVQHRSQTDASKTNNKKETLNT